MPRAVTCWSVRRWAGPIWSMSGRIWRGPLPIMACPGAAQRQRAALCQPRGGRLVAAGGAADQGRRDAGADRPRPAAGERPSRALASDAQAGDGEPTGAFAESPDRTLRSLPAQLQPRPPARGPRPAAADHRLSSLAAELGRSAARARVRRRCPGPPRPRQRRDQMARRPHLPQRNPDSANRSACGRPREAATTSGTARSGLPASIIAAASRATTGRRQSLWI